MQPTPDQARNEPRRVVITLRAQAATPPSRPEPWWTVIDAAVAAVVLVVAGWLLAPIVIILTATGRYHRIAATHPVLGDHRIGWLGRAPTRGTPLDFPRRLLPLLVFDLAMGSLSLRPAGRRGWISNASSGRSSSHVPRIEVIDLTDSKPPWRVERGRIDA